MKKGQTNNPHGRPKGAPNKVTVELRDWVKQLIENNKAQLEIDLLQLDPTERWRVIERLMNYSIPKMSAVEAKVDITALSEEQLDKLIRELQTQILKNDLL